ncbi:hypothetical protein ZWY2020_057347 [Hordeum vulgare]|nr:hypothetical protein ZWY2020_057347 [Hordeum vulgare]
MGMGRRGGGAVAVGRKEEEEEDGARGGAPSQELAGGGDGGVALALSGVFAAQPPPQRAGQGRGGHRVHVRAPRMLQAQFAVSVNLVATFHYEKQRPALDQYTD